MSYIDYANAEFNFLERCNGVSSEIKYNISKQKIIDALLMLSDQEDSGGHSGTTFSFVLPELTETISSEANLNLFEKIFFDRLKIFKPITPLMGVEEEWLCINEDTVAGITTYQSKRSPGIFKEHNSVTNTDFCYDIDAVVFYSPWIEKGIWVGSTVGGDYGTRKEITFPYNVPASPERHYFYDADYSLRIPQTFAEAWLSSMHKSYLLGFQPGTIGHFRKPGDNSVLLLPNQENKVPVTNLFSFSKTLLADTVRKFTSEVSLHEVEENYKSFFDWLGTSIPWTHYPLVAKLISEAEDLSLVKDWKVYKQEVFELSKCQEQWVPANLFTYTVSDRPEDYVNKRVYIDKYKLVTGDIDAYVIEKRKKRKKIALRNTAY